jgi:hypothetical protein
VDCSKGKYRSANVSSICTDCPFGRWSNQVAVTSIDQCFPCPEYDGVICDVGSIIPFVPSGLFRSLNGPGIVLPCNPSESCQEAGYLNTSCANGYTGPICSLCDYEHFRQSRRCLKCIPKAARVVILIVCTILGVIMLLKLSNAENQVSSVVRFILFWFQFMSILPSLSDRWPCSSRNVERSTPMPRVSAKALQEEKSLGHFCVVSSFKCDACAYNVNQMVSCYSVNDLVKRCVCF